MSISGKNDYAFNLKMHKVAPSDFANHARVYIPRSASQPAEHTKISQSTSNKLESCRQCEYKGRRWSLWEVLLHLWTSHCFTTQKILHCWGQHAAHSTTSRLRLHRLFLLADLLILLLLSSTTVLWFLPREESLNL